MIEGLKRNDNRPQRNFYCIDRSTDSTRDHLVVIFRVRIGFRLEVSRAENTQMQPTVRSQGRWTSTLRCVKSKRATARRTDTLSDCAEFSPRSFLLPLILILPLFCPGSDVRDRISSAVPRSGFTRCSILPRLWPPFDSFEKNTGVLVREGEKKNFSVERFINDFNERGRKRLETIRIEFENDRIRTNRSTPLFSLSISRWISFESLLLRFLLC